ncbi:hypothetical protein ACLOJK_014987 [Asimina triloba]
MQKIRHEEMINRGQRSIKQPFIASDREQMGETHQIQRRAAPPPSSTTPASPPPISSAIQRPPITSRCLDPVASHNRTHHHGLLHVSVQRRPASAHSSLARRQICPLQSTITWHASVQHRAARCPAVRAAPIRSQIQKASKAGHCHLHGKSKQAKLPIDSKPHTYNRHPSAPWPASLTTSKRTRTPSRSRHAQIARAISIYEFGNSMAAINDKSMARWATLRSQAPPDSSKPKSPGIVLFIRTNLAPPDHSSWSKKSA